MGLFFLGIYGVFRLVWAWFLAHFGPIWGLGLDFGPFGAYFGGLGLDFGPFLAYFGGVGLVLGYFGPISGGMGLDLAISGLFRRSGPDFGPY